MTFKTWFFILLILLVVYLFAFDFQFHWNVDPLPNETMARVIPTIDNPNPPEPQTTCTAYGFKQEKLNIIVVFKKICNTTYVTNQ